MSKARIPDFIWTYKEDPWVIKAQPPLPVAREECEPGMVICLIGTPSSSVDIQVSFLYEAEFQL